MRLADPESELADLPWLNSGELAQLADWNETRADFPGERSLAELFAEQVATRGDEPFRDAYVSDNNLVRLLDAPSVVMAPEPDQLGAALLDLLDEFERAQRFGFDDGELQRAVNAARTAGQAAYDQRDTVQDAAYADQYANSFLTGAPIIGGFQCNLHGGASPQAQRSARSRLLALVDPLFDRIEQLMSSRCCAGTSIKRGSPPLSP